MPYLNIELKRDNTNLNSTLNDITFKADNEFKRLFKVNEEEANRFSSNINGMVTLLILLNV